MIDLIYSDPSILVVKKKAGIAAQPERGAKDSLLSLLTKEYSAVFPIHRLDRETGGVLVFARSSAAAAALSEALREGGFEKEYLAVTASGALPESGKMEDYLLHDTVKNKSFAVSSEKKNAKRASLVYETLAHSGIFRLVKIHLETGRTHQIRVQFASRKSPLVGDRKYGGILAPELALFSTRLAFPHPNTGELLSFSALPPIHALPWTAFREEIEKFSAALN